ncbi:MAG TPA: TerB family tellurite resistance protein [Gemmatimonadaceae bacterium]|nr:TerB family tellurite resistance protein [Gemmatimonadaceae bacterium]
MLLDAIRALLRAPADAPPDAGPAAPEVDPLHLAACVLLLDVAYADGEFSAPERAHLETVLEQHFGLPPATGARLVELADAERRRAVDHFHFTSVLQRGFDEAQKRALAEALWGLVLADGQVAEHEHYLARKIANMLDLHPADLHAAKAAAARKREA